MKLRKSPNDLRSLLRMNRYKSGNIGPIITLFTIWFRHIPRRALVRRLKHLALEIYVSKTRFHRELY